MKHLSYYNKFSYFETEGSAAQQLLYGSTAPGLHYQKL